MTLPNPSSYADYGASKVDYLVEVTDPTTDRSAAELNQALADTSSLTRTGIRAMIRFTTQSTSAPTLSTYEQMWGVAVTPTLARTGVGTYTITFPTSVTDPLGGTQLLNLRFANVSLETSGVGNVPYATVTAPNVVTVEIVSPPSTPNDTMSAVCVVYVA